MTFKNQNTYNFVFIATIFLDSKEEYFSGGAEIHLKNICSLLKENNKVLVIQMSPTNQTKLIYKDGIEIFFVKSLNKFHYTILVANILRSLNTPFVHFNYFGLDKFVYKKKNVTYSATFHGTAWDFPTSNLPKKYFKHQAIYSFGAKIKKRLMLRTQKKALKKMDKILAVDTTLLLYAQQFFTNLRNKVEVVYNFVDTEKFKPSIENIKGDSFNILYPRNISFARGVHLLIPIALELKNKKIPFILNMVGLGISEIGGDKYENILREEIKINNLEEHFNFLGRINHAEMPKVFSNTDMVLIPTFFSEGTSLSCLEAMASGKIVLATNIGGLNDLIIDGYNGFLSKPIAEELATKIIHIYKNFKNLDYINSNALSVVSNCNSLPFWRIKISNYFNLHNE